MQQARSLMTSAKYGVPAIVEVNFPALTYRCAHAKSSISTMSLCCILPLLAAIWRAVLPSFSCTLMSMPLQRSSASTITLKPLKAAGPGLCCPRLPQLHINVQIGILGDDVRQG